MANEEIEFTDVLNDALIDDDFKGAVTRNDGPDSGVDSDLLDGKDSSYYATKVNLDNHIADIGNPHSVTKHEIGLGAVDNTSDLNKPISEDTQNALDDKEDGIGDPAANYRMKAYHVDGSMEYMAIPSGSGSTIWGDIVGEIEDQTDLQLKLDGKESGLGLPDADGYVLSSNMDGTRYWKQSSGGGSTSFISLVDTPASYLNNAGKITAVSDTEDSLIFIDAPQSETSWGAITGTLSDQEDLQTALDAKAIATDVYDKTDFISETNGAAEANLPVKTNASGKLSMTFLDLSAFVYQGSFTPIAEAEYPDTSSAPYGSFWDIIGVDNVDGYTFVGGILVDQVVRNGDMIIYGETTEWTIKKGSIEDPSAYYRIDGTVAIIASFSGGGQKFINAADGTENTDLVTMQQLATKATETYVDDANALQDIEIADIDTRLTSHTDTSTNPHSITPAQIAAEPELGNPDVPGKILSSTETGERSWIALPDGSVWGGITGDIDNQADLTTELGKKATKIEFDAHATSLLNPHEVTKSQVGLGSVDNTSDLAKPISTATQTALDTKEALLGNPTEDGMVLSSTVTGARSWIAQSAGGGTLPIGFVGMYVGLIADIPEDWALCDGTNGTVDMSDRFIMGTTTEEDILNTGGSNDAVNISHAHTVTDHTHSVPSHTHGMSSHTHSGSTGGDGGHNHGNTLKYDGGTFWFQSNTGPGSGWLIIDDGTYVGVADVGDHTHSLTTGGPSSNTSEAWAGTSGGATPGTSTDGETGTGLNRPLYAIMAFIQKIA